MGADAALPSLTRGPLRPACSTCRGPAARPQPSPVARYARSRVGMRQPPADPQVSTHRLLFIFLAKPTSHSCPTPPEPPHVVVSSVGIATGRPRHVSLAQRTIVDHHRRRISHRPSPRSLAWSSPEVSFGPALRSLMVSSPLPLSIPILLASCHARRGARSSWPKPGEPAQAAVASLRSHAAEAPCVVVCAPSIVHRYKVKPVAEPHASLCVRW